MESVRIYEMPDCRMVKSGSGLFGESALERFEAWMDRQPKGMFPRDYLSFDGKGFVWYYLYEDGMDVPEEFEIVDFPGGLYAVAAHHFSGGAGGHGLCADGLLHAGENQKLLKCGRVFSKWQERRRRFAIILWYSDHVRINKAWILMERTGSGRWKNENTCLDSLCDYADGHSRLCIG